MVSFVYLLATVFIQPTRGDNIMLNKPSTQSSTIYGAQRANDGEQSYSQTTYQLNPFWQGDLMENYLIGSITITATTYSINHAYIGVSSRDVTTDPSGEVEVCGQWPTNTKATLTFFCNNQRPFRYVRIWVQSRFQLSINEVAVQEMSHKLTGMNMNLDAFQKLITVTKNLKANTSTECANACFTKQPCVAFSFNIMAQDCLLASARTTTSHENWVTYQMGHQSVCP